MEFGEDLSLNLLGEDDNLIFDDIMVDTSGAPKKEVQPPVGKKIDESGEDIKSPESVAGEEGKTKIPGKEGSISSPNDDLSPIYSSLAAHLHDSGVLSNLKDDKPIKDFNSLKDAIAEEIKNGISETQRAYKEAAERGVAEDDYFAYEKMMSQLNNITETVLQSPENAELRGKIIAQDFLNRGFDKEDAEKYAKRSIDLGEDLEDATKSLGRIKEFTTSEFQKRQEAEKAKEESVNKDIKQFIDKKKEFIDGIDIDENQKEKLYKQITTPVARDKAGTILSKYGKALKDDPIEMRVTTEYLFMITDGFKDFSKLNNTIETAKTKELDTLLKNNSSAFMTDGTGSKRKDDQTNFLMGDLEIDI